MATPPSKSLWSKLLTFTLILAVGLPLLACQVPVFRYALERWDADSYRVFVVHDSKLDADTSQVLKSLRKRAEASGQVDASIELQVLDVSGDSKDQIPQSVRDAFAAGDGTPGMYVYYPLANGVGRSTPMYECRLTQEAVDVFADSPVRKKVCDRLQRGDSAVWIFVPCGRDEEDAAALKRLKDQIAADEEWLELPSAEELEVQPEVLSEVKVPLQIQFSTVVLNRDDPAEQFLLQSLLNSEEDLTSFDQPLAFPVFGRGRVLYALVGKGIASDTVRSASTFMAGPCSCQVKNQNPGFDLLLQADWKTALGDVLISEPIESVDTEALAPKLLTIPPGRRVKK